MKTCANCLFWRKLGDAFAARHVHYANRHVEVAPGPEGQCRAAPPPEDNRWPMVSGGDWCGRWQGGCPSAWRGQGAGAQSLTEGGAPRTGAVGATRGPDGGSSVAAGPVTPEFSALLREAGQATPPVEAATGSPLAGPASTSRRLTGQHRRTAGPR